MFNKPCSQLDSPWNELTQNDSYLQTNSGLENSYHLKLLWKMAVFLFKSLDLEIKSMLDPALFDDL